MSIESEGATSNVELQSALARGGDLVLHETVNLEGEPPSPKTPAEQKRETRLEALAAEIESVLGTAIMRVAALVAEAHELHRYQHGDGGFEGWVERRLKMSRRTAYNLLDVHKRFGDQSVQILHTLPRSVLYLIAPDSVPEAARNEVIERAQAGEKLSHAKVKAIITGRKPKALAPNKNRKRPKQAQASRDVTNEPTLFDSLSLAPETAPERKIEAASPAERKRDVAPPVAPTEPASSPDPGAALPDNTTMPTTAGVTAKEEPKPVESTPPPDPIILSADADLDTVDRAIEVLYSRWCILALRLIEKAIHDEAAVRTVNAIHHTAAGFEMRNHYAKNSEAERQARKLRIFAEKKLGKWLIDTQKTGVRYMGRPSKGVKIGTPPDPDVITLKKLGISKRQSQAYQRIARMTARQFAALVEGKPARRHLPHRKYRVRRLRPAA